MQPWIKSSQRVYCLGIGGVGVGALAEYLHHQGCQVTGSDTQPSAMTMRLQHLGIPIFNEHQVEHLRDIDLVVYSSAIHPEHPVLQEAQALKIPLMQRGKLLANILQGYQSIVVAGTHGKTTTVSLLAYLMKAQGVSLNHFIGGTINGETSPIAINDSQYMLAEADESDGSFLFIHPNIAVITNIDADHLASYRDSFSVLKDSFRQFIAQVHADGLVVLCIDHPVVRELLPLVDRPVVTYGFSNDADYRADHYQQKELNSTFTLTTPSLTEEVQFNLPGQHNVLNLLASIAVADYLQGQKPLNLQAMGGFPGVGRRLQLHASCTFNEKAVHIFEDYGHHPEEIAVTINTLRQAWPDRRLIMAFQPHRYSRTQELFAEFSRVLSQVDALLLLDVFSAGEELIPGASSDELAGDIQAKYQVESTRVSDGDKLQAVLREKLLPGDVVLFQGAGSIGRMAKDFSLRFV